MKQIMVMKVKTKSRKYLCAAGMQQSMAEKNGPDAVAEHCRKIANLGGRGHKKNK